MEHSPSHQLRKLIDRLILSEEDRSPPVLAAWVMEREPELIDAITPHWQKLALLSLIRHRLDYYANLDPHQLEFPFEDLTVQIPLMHGSVELRRATIGKLRECERYLRKKRQKPRANSMLERIQRQIRLMEPYVKAADSRRLTVEQVEAMRAKAIPPGLPTFDVSRSMKRHWATKTPQERSATANPHKRKKQPV